ncbi:MAG: ATP-dependent DNA helicase RecG [Bdellovibrionaceae bacterium]|nr:ATP-dependent DNA helicase RecG [Pseudobdellovibrionaceae bacterium]
MNKNQITLDTPLQFIKGVGPKLGEILKKSSLLTVNDMIHRLPRAYQDNRRVVSFSDLSLDQQVIVQADIVKKSIIPLRSRNKRIYEILISDGSQIIPCKFFTLPYKNWFNSLRVGERVEVRGKVTLFRNRFTFNHPQLFPSSPEEEIKNQDLVLPLYSEIDSITQHKIRSIIKEIFTHLFLSDKDFEWLPAWLIKKYKLISRLKALKGVHFPDSKRIDDYLKFQTEFQKRLIFDEFFELQFYFALKNQGWKIGKADPIQINNEYVKEIQKNLVFDLTLAQKKVLKDIFSDLKSTYPMHRLLQGDVGCGKTVVALISALVCAKQGYQTAIMVPTEILAEQHYKNASHFLEPFGIKVEKLTGKMKPSQKRTVSGVLQSGFCQVCIGTHALIQENIQFNKLAFVVIDEQHRFGAHQRALLKSKGIHPHFLVMTATPIPRTLSMAIYGDLDVSVIDEMPKGRIPIVTRRVFPKKRKEVFDFLRDQVKTGRQAYVVYPLVEESEKLDLKNAMDQYEKLKNYYKDLKWGLLTGRMNSDEKKDIMNRFIKKEIQVLVSTTVIEVGVDVPNASVMVIENAERFGLSQLHQLRGRVGRGAYKSYCIVVLGERFSKESAERAYIMQSTLDGFKIAEKDLEIRGPGEFLGSRQSGLPSFRIANIIRDSKSLSLAKQSAFDLISKDPYLQKIEHQKIKDKFKELSTSIQPG